MQNIYFILTTENNIQDAQYFTYVKVKIRCIILFKI